MLEKYGKNNRGKGWRRRSLPAFLAAALFAVFLLSFAPSPAAGAEKRGSLTIRYFDLDGEPVGGAEFSLRLVAEPMWDGGYRSLLSREIDAETEPSEIAVLAEELPAITLSIAEDGSGKAGSLPEGLYLVEETLPAEGHFASVPFIAAIPDREKEIWTYDVEAEPKPLAAGELRITKTVAGEGRETDRRFSFRVRIGDDGEFPVRYSTGETGSIRTGDTVSLRHGESATVSMLPAGTAYEVEEIEADEDGYRTTASGEEGNIEAKKTAEAAFVNERGATPTPGLPPHYPPQTGDQSHAGFYLLLGITAAMALIAVLFGRRKRKKGA